MNKQNLTELDLRFIELADIVSTFSQDKSTKIGAVLVDDNGIVLETAFNTFPKGLDTTIQSRFERPDKYLYTEHAERALLYKCCKNGIKTNGTTMYIQWFSCAECARAIIMSGVKTVVCQEPDFKNDEKSQRWEESQKVAMQMFKEAGIEIIYY